MSGLRGNPRDEGTRSRPGRASLSPTAVLLWGLLGAVVCLLLLYGPFHGARYEAPVRNLRIWLWMIVDAVADTTP